jgi:hydroxypyruvate reductase
VRTDGETLWIADEPLPLGEIKRIAVVGAGKAGAGMAAGLLEALGSRLVEEKQVTGWLNVPADCVRPLPPLHLHAARPAGRNEPTAEGVAGAEAILQLVGALQAEDLCFCLISGGGSALLPAPVEGITLADKLAVTQVLSAAGANIAELNAVRKRLSRIKGGGLARACRAGRLVVLIISDVLGDPLDVIASGPTVVGGATAEQALAVLERFDARGRGVPEAVFETLQHQAASLSAARIEKPAPDGQDVRPTDCGCEVRNLVIGNNAVAVDAAGMEAERLGYSHAMHATRELEGPAEDVGRHLAEMAVRMRDEGGPDCLITGGEPTVALAAEPLRGLGGRNQQLALAALEVLQSQRGGEGIVLLSGGTDGEDGPTDAAGAIVDAELIAAARLRKLSSPDFLHRNDAYHFFGPLGGLIQTGPTHTNVCDLRVVVVDPAKLAGQTPLSARSRQARMPAPPPKLDA